MQILPIRARLLGAKNTDFGFLSASKWHEFEWLVFFVFFLCYIGKRVDLYNHPRRKGKNIYLLM